MVVQGCQPRGFTTGEGTGVEVALGCSDSLVQPPPFWEHQGETVGEGETAERVLTLSSIVVFDDTLGDGGQREDPLDLGVDGLENEGAL